MSHTYYKIDSVCLGAEQVLNMVGYVPFIGKISAFARVIVATAQVAAGLAVAIFAALALVYHKIKGNREEVDNYTTHLKNNLNYVGQGLLNYSRAFIEYVPFLPLITCLPYDYFCARYNFKVLKYSTEETVDSWIFDAKR